MAQIKPIKQETQDSTDPFFPLSGLEKRASLSNAEMDDIIYRK